MKRTLIGMFDSPFVRRVAITMKLYDMGFEHHPWSVFGDYERVRALNPLGRVPVLLLDDDEVLIESSAILDHLDQSAGPDRALTPPSGPERRRALKHLAIALGGCEKAVAHFYETVKRDSRYTDPDWAARLRGQVHHALDWVEDHVPGEKAPFDQRAVTSSVFWRFVCEYLPDLAAEVDVPRLRVLTERCEATPAFQAIPFGEAATVGGG